MITLLPPHSIYYLLSSSPLSPEERLPQILLRILELSTLVAKKSIFWLRSCQTLDPFLYSPRAWNHQVNELSSSIGDALPAPWYSLEIGAVSPFVRSTELLNHLLHKLLFVLKTCFLMPCGSLDWNLPTTKLYESLCIHINFMYIQNTDLGVNIKVSILGDTQNGS